MPQESHSDESLLEKPRRAKLLVPPLREPAYLLFMDNSAAEQLLDDKKGPAANEAIDA